MRGSRSWKIDPLGFSFEVTPHTLPRAASITGLLEVRGIGIVQVQTAMSPVHVELVVSHADTANQERMPAAREIELAGCNLPLYKIDFSAASAAAYIRILAQLQWGLISSINR